MSESPKGSITVFIKRFKPHNEGTETLPHDGTKGFYEEWKTIEQDKDNIFTNAGHDFVALQCYSTTPGGNGANYIALTNDSAAPNVADTTLTSEIVINGLQRAQGAYAHTPGTNTETIIKTFTATDTQASQKAGLFTAASVGTLVNESTYGPVTLNNGDQLQIIWTITS